jgi:hypothetical protein
MGDDAQPLRPGVNVKHGERFMRGDDLEPVLRDPLALAMLAAWVNVPVDKLPANMRAHTCAATMASWKRVGDAALAYLETSRVFDLLETLCEAIKPRNEQLAHDIAASFARGTGGVDIAEIVAVLVAALESRLAPTEERIVAAIKFTYPDRDLRLNPVQETEREYWHPLIAAILATETKPGAGGGQFQQRVRPWMLACFGEEIAGDRDERNHRFLEEALELVQSTGCTAYEAHQLVDYVYGREVGEPSQEVGGVMVTLAALCLANSLDMHANGETELARIWTKVEAIRVKQAAKPKHLPLPQHATPKPTTPERANAMEEAAQEVRRRVKLIVEAQARQWFCSGDDCTEYDSGRDEGLRLALRAIDFVALTPALSASPPEVGKNEEPPCAS